jgi:hypothetical protein
MTEPFMPPPPPPIPVVTAEKKLHELKMLVEVMDTDLKPMFDLRRRIKEGSLTHIAFQDLWHLFEFGQDVRTSDAELQFYRVVRYSGGRPDLVPRLGDMSGLRMESWKLCFTVDVVHLDFDGNVYGSIQQSFIIRKYDGEKPITSLPIFPVAFDPDRKALRKYLNKRGDTWLELTQADRSTHKHYIGLTLDEPQPEEVSRSTELLLSGTYEWKITGVALQRQTHLICGQSQSWPILDS